MAIIAMHVQNHVLQIKLANQDEAQTTFIAMQVLGVYHAPAKLPPPDDATMSEKSTFESKKNSLRPLLVV
jgi:hypothetical protein